MSEPIVVHETVRVPGSAITVRAARASGPGGRHVNKVATKIDLRVDLDAFEGLTVPARRRLLELAARRLDGRGRLAATSQVTRTQSQNLEDARGTVRELIAAALIRPRPRRATLSARTSEAGAGVETNRWRTRRPAAGRDTAVQADSPRALTHQPPTASLPDTGNTPWDRIAELLIELALEHDPAILEPVSRSRSPR